MASRDEIARMLDPEAYTVEPRTLAEACARDSRRWTAETLAGDLLRRGLTVVPVGEAGSTGSARPVAVDHIRTHQ